MIALGLAALALLLAPLWSWLAIRRRHAELTAWQERLELAMRDAQQEAVRELERVRRDLSPAPAPSPSPSVRALERVQAHLERVQAHLERTDARLAAVEAKLAPPPPPPDPEPLDRPSDATRVYGTAEEHEALLSGVEVRRLPAGAAPPPPPRLAPPPRRAIMPPPPARRGAA